MGDKKTVYTFPIYFGDHCYIGDEMFRRQYLQHTSRSAAAVTEVEVTRCYDQRCSYWTPFNSRPDEPAGNSKAKTELGGGTPVGPAKTAPEGGNFVGPVKTGLGGRNTEGLEKIERGGGTPVGSADAMGPLNIMAAIIPLETTWPTADADHLSSGSSESSMEIQFDDDDVDVGEEK